LLELLEWEGTAGLWPVWKMRVMGTDVPDASSSAQERAGLAIFTVFFMLYCCIYGRALSISTARHRAILAGAQEAATA